MRTFVVAAALVAGNACAADVTLEVQNVAITNGAARAVMRLQNSTSSAIAAVFIDCAFMGDGGKAIGIGRAIATNIAAGGDAYEEAVFPTKASVSSVRCRISKIRP